MTERSVIEDSSIGDVGGGGKASDYIRQHVARWSNLIIMMITKSKLQMLFRNRTVRESVSVISYSDLISL